MIHPLKLEHASRALYEQQLQILSKEEKLSIQQEIHKHKVKSVPIIFFSMLVAVGALFALCIGSMLCFIGNALFLSEIFLPFILPGILALIPVALLLYVAWKEQKLVTQKQQQIATSCYFESVAFCKDAEPKELSVKQLVNFLRSEILPEGFSKRFTFAVLTLAKPSLLIKKTSLTKTSFDETIETAFSHVREGLYLSESEKRDHESQLEKQESSATPFTQKES